MKDPDIYLEQAGLKSLGFDPGPLDGIRGPKTKAARSAWESSLAPGGRSTVADRIFLLADADLWIREIEGKNRGPGIEKYWEATSYPNGYEFREPYCAAAVCWWVREAVSITGTKPAFLLPTSARAFDFEKWGKNNAGKGVQLIDKAAEILPGDIIVWDFSHVSVAASRTPRGGSMVATIDANTSPSSGDNEGGGVFRRTRTRSQIRAIVRITA